MEHIIPRATVMTRWIRYVEWEDKETSSTTLSQPPGLYFITTYELEKRQLRSAGTYVKQML
jgi:hypothetical protein